MHKLSKNAFWGQFQWNIFAYCHTSWNEGQISPYFSTWKLSSLTFSHMAKSSIWVFRQHRMHKFLKFLPQRVWHLSIIIERKEIYRVSRQRKIPSISKHFAKFDHKGELWAVFSAIYYLKSERIENKLEILKKLKELMKLKQLFAKIERND